MTITDQLTDRPQTKRELSQRTGYSTRDVELLIQAARLEGHPICSDDRGYWYAQTAAEVRECADRLRRRYIHQALTARALRQAARRMETRTALTLWDVA